MPRPPRRDSHGLTSLIWHDSIFVFAVGVLVVMVLRSALNYKNAVRLGGVTVSIIVLIPYHGPVWRIAAKCFAEVSFGIVVSLCVAVAWTTTGRWLHREKV